MPVCSDFNARDKTKTWASFRQKALEACAVCAALRFLFVSAILDSNAKDYLDICRIWAIHPQ